MPTCPCGCAAPTTRLFAPGHDARYKSALRAAFVASPDAPAKVLWDDVPTTVEDAVDRIAAALGSDWSAVPSGGKPQPANVRPPSRRPEDPPVTSETPPSPAMTPSAHRPAPSAPSRRRSTPRETRSVREQRLDALMERLDTTVRVGHWGWYRPQAAPDTRFAARVHRTYRDQGSSTLDLFVPQALPGTLDAIVTGVHPDSFFRDDMARP